MKIKFANIVMAGITQKKAENLYFHCCPFWKIKKENFSVGKCCYNNEKAIERRLTKKWDSLVKIFVKTTIKT